MNSNARRRQQHQGFSMIELVIVVVIIAIIGAIAIPRLSRGTEGAADSSLAGNLAVLRNAVDLYAAEHRGAYPSLANFEAQLTQYTDATGNTSATPGSDHIYGPYLRAIPPLPVGDNQGERGLTDTRGTGGAGWYYDETTGEIRANVAAEDDRAADAEGREYWEY